MADLVYALKHQTQHTRDPSQLDFNQVVNLIQKHSQDHLQSAFNYGIKINQLESQRDKLRERLRTLATIEKPEENEHEETQKIQQEIKSLTIQLANVWKEKGSVVDNFVNKKIETSNGYPELNSFVKASPSIKQTSRSGYATPNKKSEAQF